LEIEMLKFELNWIHVALVALLNFVLGWAWYSPLLFVKPWMRGLGKDPETFKPSTQDQEAMPRLMAGALLAAILTSLGMAVLVASVGATDAVSGLELGLLAGLAFVASHGIGTAFEGRKMVVITISVGYSVATLVLDGAIHGAWR
jgi:hypothetical protein